MNLGYFLRYCLIALISAMFFCAIISYAEDDSLKECMDNFDINRVDFRSSDAAQYSYLLKDYLLCRAAATDNLNECYKLINPEECLRVSNIYWVYYGRLMAKKRMTPQIMNACRSSAGDREKTESGCDILPRAILNEDVSVCENIKNEFQRDFCRAVAAKNTRLCPDKQCQGLVFYLQALKNSDVKLCDRISNTPLQWICKGGVGVEKRICEQDEGFKEFIKIYCEQERKMIKNRGKNEK